MTKWLILFGVIVFLCIVEWIRENVTFQVTHYDIQSDKKDNNNDSVPTKTLPMLLFCLIFLPVGTFSVFYIIKRKTKKLNAGEL